MYFAEKKEVSYNFFCFLFLAVISWYDGLVEFSDKWENFH